VLKDFSSVDDLYTDSEDEKTAKGKRPYTKVNEGGTCSPMSSNLRELIKKSSYPDEE
jgi:hypothetical protein